MAKQKQDYKKVLAEVNAEAAQAEREAMLAEQQETTVDPILEVVMKDIEDPALSEEFTEQAGRLGALLPRRKEAIVAYRQGEKAERLKNRIHRELCDRPGVYQDEELQIMEFEEELKRNEIVDGYKIWEPPAGSNIVAELEKLQAIHAKRLQKAMESIDANIELIEVGADEEMMEWVKAEQETKPFVPFHVAKKKEGK